MIPVQIVQVMAQIPISRKMLLNQVEFYKSKGFDHVDVITGSATDRALRRYFSSFITDDGDYELTIYGFTFKIIDQRD